MARDDSPLPTPHRNGPDLSETVPERPEVGRATDLHQTLPDDAAEALDDLSDRELGEFRLLRRIGQGGMAEVYLAEQTSLERKVALKVLRSEAVSASNDTLLQRFRQEATAVGRLTHSGIVHVYVIGEAEGVHYIAQEYVAGLNLRQHLQRNGPPDAALAVRLLRQVADALEAAHAEGVVHRDVKPENILLTRKLGVKVADFGLARLMQQEKGTNLTEVGITMGTPLYMSPEQVNGKSVDHRTDLYSLGVTAYHLLAGEPPFRGETALAIAVKHLQEQPAPLAERRPDLPRELCDLVHRMLAKRPDDRPQSAAEVVRELQRIGEVVSQSGRQGALTVESLRAPSRNGAPWARVGRILQRRDVLLFLAAGLLVAGTSAALGWWMRPADPLASPPATATRVPRQESAAAQIYHAWSLVDDEDAWQAVIEYFGDDPSARREVARARQQLGLLYLRQRRLSEAESTYRELLADAEDDVEFRATAYAGLAVTSSLQRRFDESQRLMVELIPDREALNSDMESLVRETIQRNREHLGDAFRKDLEDLFQEDPVDVNLP